MRKRDHPIYLHLMFWTGYFVVTFTLMIGFMPLHYALQRVFTNGIIHMILVYTNLYVLMPYILLKGRYFLYYFLFGVMLVLSSVLMTHIDYWVGFSGPFGMIRFFSFAHYSSKIITGITVLGFSSIIKVLEARQEQLQTQQELLNYKLEAELKLLKNQVNPHFLFNALNNIYSLVYTGSKDAAPMVLKLSDMMRYMLHGSNQTLVPLTSEIEYLDNYISLQQVRKKDKPQAEFIVEGDVEEVNVAPMLFIPFFENAFKHGNILEDRNGFMRGVMRVADKRLFLKLENSVPNKPTRKDAVGGIGLENTRKRLDLIYPNKHRLELLLANGIYTVELEIDLS